MLFNIQQNQNKMNDSNKTQQQKEKSINIVVPKHNFQNQKGDKNKKEKMFNEIRRRCMGMSYLKDYDENYRDKTGLFSFFFCIRR